LLLEKPTRTPFDSGIRQIEIKKLWQEFVDAALPIAVKIICEVHLPVNEKTIKPSTSELGGVAGGAKFVVNNALFKVCTNSLHIFCIFI